MTLKDVAFSLVKIVYKALMRLVSPLLDVRARYHLRRIQNKKMRDGAGGPIKVAFFVFEPETWDKQEPVYLELSKMTDVQVDVVVFPNFNTSFSTEGEYGQELAFFQESCQRVIPAYEENGILADFTSDPYDYIFYGDSYNRHMPIKYRSWNMVKFSKICYIPYGYSGSEIFGSISDNREFFRNVYLGFLDIPQKEGFFRSSYSKSCEEGLQHFEYLGYPALAQYMEKSKDVNAESSIRAKKTIVWTPRWSYDKKIGGSHFLEYKDQFIDLKDVFDVNLVLRPHPMMFEEFMRKGYLSKEEAESYVQKMGDHEISLSENEPATDILLQSDIMITDFTSLIVMFFLTGKPIIYCEGGIPFNESYNMLKKGMYVANSWDDVEKYTRDILSGNDYLAETRRAIIEKEYIDNFGSASRIAERIHQDYFGS